MTKPVKVGELSASDRELLSQARTNIEQANKTFQFVANFLAESYSLTETQAIEPNGDINDYKPVASPPELMPTDESTGPSTVPRKTKK